MCDGGAVIPVACASRSFAGESIKEESSLALSLSFLVGLVVIVVVVVALFDGQD